MKLQGWEPDSLRAETEQVPGPAEVEGQASAEQPEERAGTTQQGRTLVMELHFPGLILLQTMLTKSYGAGCVSAKMCLLKTCSSMPENSAFL